MAVPTVTTQAATNITKTSADGNGNITDTSGEFDISTATFSQSISTQDSLPLGMAWNNDGSKFYEVGSGSDLIYEYDVSTAYDISTATFSQSISTQDSSPSGIAWNNDGSKLYELGTSSDLIYESDVSTPFDISTATFSQSISAQDSTPYGIAWNNDGSKLYELGTSSDLIYEYDVSTPFNISTATFSQSISTQDSSPSGIAWNNDGSKMYEVGFSSDLIYESDVSTPFDISTATFSQSISTQDATPTGITWNNDGSKLYEVGTGSDLIYEYNVSGTASERGFVYSTTTQTDPGNTSPAASAYESVANETGTFSTGAFSLPITGLTENTTYYTRAYAENSEGYSYGDEVSFTTLRAENYSRASLATLPTNANDLDTAFTEQEYTDVSTSNDTRVSQGGNDDEYVIQQFKFTHTNDTEQITVEIEKQTDHDPAVNPVILEMYNYTTGSWEQLDSNNSASVDTDFTLSGTKTGSDYYDGDNVVAVRVYQFKSA